jgi:hypothetical protein
MDEVESLSARREIDATTQEWNRKNPANRESEDVVMHSRVLAEGVANLFAQSSQGLYQASGGHVDDR